MLRNRNPGRLVCGRSLGGMIGVLAVGLLLTVPAVAQTPSGWGEPYRGDEPLPAVLTGPDAVTAVWHHRIVGSTLKPRESGVNYATSGSGGCVYVTSGNAATVWNTPVIVANGANVQYLRIYVDDTSTSNISAWFTVYNLYGAIVQEWPVSYSAASGTGYYDTTLINHVIDYDTYSYVINMRPIGTGSTLQFCGARLFFEPPPEIFHNGFEAASAAIQVQQFPERHEGGS